MDPAEIFREAVRTWAQSLEDGRILPPQVGWDCGTSVRVWTPKGDRYACQGGAGEGAVRSCLDRLGEGSSAWPESFGGFPGEDSPGGGLAPPGWDPADRERAIRWLREVEESACRGLPGVVSCRAALREIFRDRRILLPDGAVRWQPFRWASLSLALRARACGRIREGIFRAAGAGLPFLLDSFPPSRCAEVARGDLLESGEAAGDLSGEMPVVLAGGAAGTFFHEVCGHLLEGDAPAAGFSWLAPGPEGPVFPAGLTVFDDATVPGLGGSASVDDEGTPCGEVPLIRKGRVVGRLLDRRTARLRGERSTGNGRRASYRDRPLPRVTNLCVAGGPDGAGEALGSSRSGLLVEELASGRVDPSTGEFRLAVRRGFRVEKGRAGRPVRHLLLAGTAREALAGIEIIEPGSAVAGTTGRCVREGQDLLTGLCSPPVRIRRLSVRTQAGIFQAEE